jgi:lipopolysaccharide transport system ATP-binding protein
MQTVIRVEGLGKQYRVGQRESYGSLRDSLARAFNRRSRKSVDAPMMWALKDVSFELNHGDVLGIVGTNGSGKSTLLKILSRITEPTEGWADIRGRVGSLLEVGTGFHPELTGRENVFVNGAILGMRRREIERKFDEIVAFADVDRFIDTPVKHYSSGMQMRLAFAVAAHLEPNILLVDEVLAVGDLAFQKKCLGKMDQVSRAGRTVLFVSHQMNQVRRVCSRCLWLDRGRVVDVGPTQDITTRYEASFMESVRQAPAASTMSGTRFLGWTLGDSGSGHHVLDTFGPTTVRFIFYTDREIRNAHHGIALHDANGQVVWGTGVDNVLLVPGVNELVYSLATLPLRPGPYRWLTTIYENGHFVDGGDCIPELGVQTPPLGHRQDRFAGILNCPYSFEVRRLHDSRPLSDDAPQLENARR